MDYSERAAREHYTRHGKAQGRIPWDVRLVLNYRVGASELQHQRQRKGAAPHWVDAQPARSR